MKSRRQYGWSPGARNIAEGAPGCAVAAALSGRAGGGESSRLSRAATSTSRASHRSSGRATIQTALVPPGVVV